MVCVVSPGACELQATFTNYLEHQQTSESPQEIALLRERSVIVPGCVTVAFALSSLLCGVRSPSRWAGTSRQHQTAFFL